MKGDHSPGFTEVGSNKACNAKLQLKWSYFICLLFRLSYPLCTAAHSSLSILPHLNSDFCVPTFVVPKWIILFHSTVYYCVVVCSFSFHSQLPILYIDKYRAANNAPKTNDITSKLGSIILHSTNPHFWLSHFVTQPRVLGIKNWTSVNRAPLPCYFSVFWQVEVEVKVTAMAYFKIPYPVILFCFSICSSQS